jgi:hypothetical protein
MKLQDVLKEIAANMVVDSLNVSLCASASDISVNVFTPTTIDIVYNATFRKDDDETILYAKLQAFKAAIKAMQDGKAEADDDDVIL